MQKNVMLNLLAFVGLSLLCSCGESQKKQEEAQPVQQVAPQEQPEIPVAIAELQQEAFMDFPDDDDLPGDDEMFAEGDFPGATKIAMIDPGEDDELQEDGDDDGDMFDQKA